MTLCGLPDEIWEFEISKHLNRDSKLQLMYTCKTAHRLMKDGVRWQGLMSMRIDRLRLRDAVQDLRNVRDVLFLYDMGHLLPRRWFCA